MGISTMYGTEVAFGGSLWRGGLAGRLLGRLRPGRRNVGNCAARTGQLLREEAEKPATAVPGGLGRRDALDATC